MTITFPAFDWAGVLFWIALWALLCAAIWGWETIESWVGRPTKKGGKK